MQNLIHSYTTAIHGNTRAIQHISTVNHWLREVVYNTSAEYTTFLVTGIESIKKSEGEVVEKDRERDITSASEQAAESLGTLKDVRKVAFERKVTEAHPGSGFNTSWYHLTEAKKGCKVAQLASSKACRAAN
jgi:hypothetical protein